MGSSQENRILSRLKGTVQLMLTSNTLSAVKHFPLALSEGEYLQVT